MKKQTDLFSEWLSNYIDFEYTTNTEGFSLDTMRFLVARAGMPQDSFRSVHVAGSKGKGSVSSMIARILTEAGMPAGLYTSPHISDFTERVTGPRGIFPDEIYGKAADFLVSRVESVVTSLIPGGKAPSWFELVTLFAMLTFREAGVPWAVFETGLGGRLDATNVLIPEASVITPIELEHTRYLGGTKKEIAGEKAGIIKPGVPVFVAAQDAEARDVFARTAREKNAPVFFMDEAVVSLKTEYEGTSLRTEIRFNEIPNGAAFRRPLNFKLNLLPEVQAENAALAAYTVKTLLPKIGEETLERALSSCKLPGRFEIARENPPVVLDGAHTENSVRGTMRSFLKLYPGEKHLLFACAADKNAGKISAQFDGVFSSIILTKPGDKKESDVQTLVAAFRENCRTAAGGEARCIPDCAEAIPAALAAAEKENAALLITGSFYLLAEVKKILADRRPDSES